MKKIFTLFAFALIFMLGTQSGIAQNKIEINRVAAEKTEALYKTLKFSTEQRHLVYNAMKEFGKDMARYNQAGSNNEEEKKKIREQLDVRIKEILNEEQYDRYKNLDN